METISTVYKYQADFELLAITCPPPTYTGRAMPAFRWVFDSMQHADNFKSQYHRKPKRFLTKADAEKCSAMALSMFESLGAAQNRFAALKQTMGENVYKTLGTHVAAGSITKEDGVNSQLDKNRHFNHHCRLGCNYEERFQIVAAL